jgi:hypothetical protein
MSAFKSFCFALAFASLVGVGYTMTNSPVTGLPKAGGSCCSGSTSCCSSGGSCCSGEAPCCQAGTCSTTGCTEECCSSECCGQKCCAEGCCAGKTAKASSCCQEQAGACPHAQKECAGEGECSHADE